MLVLRVYPTIAVEPVVVSRHVQRVRTCHDDAQQSPGSAFQFRLTRWDPLVRPGLKGLSGMLEFESQRRLTNAGVDTVELGGQLAFDLQVREEHRVLALHGREVVAEEGRRGAVLRPGESSQYRRQNAAISRLLSQVRNTGKLSWPNRVGQG